MGVSEKSSTVYQGITEDDSRAPCRKLAPFALEKWEVILETLHVDATMSHCDTFYSVVLPALYSFTNSNRPVFSQATANDMGQFLGGPPYSRRIPLARPLRSKRPFRCQLTVQLSFHRVQYQVPDSREKLPRVRRTPSSNVDTGNPRMGRNNEVSRWCLGKPNKTGHSQ